MATEFHLITQNGTAGSYWAGLTTEQKDRYYFGGAYKVYATYNAWKTALYNSGTQDASKAIVCEVGDAFTDTSSGYVSGWEISGYYSITWTSMVNGVRSAAYHGGIAGAGYIRQDSSQYGSSFLSNNSNTTVDGLEFRQLYNSGSPYGTAVNIGGVKCTIKNVIARCTALSAYLDRGGANVFSNCIAMETAKTTGSIGFRISSYAGNGTIINNCLATGYATGFKLDTTGNDNKTIFINNIAYNNTLNYGTAGTGYCGYNAGESGDTVWGSSTALTNIVAGDFDSNFMPASSSSHQVNTGTPFISLYAADMLDKYRPDYESTTYPSNLWDIGPFEYDHGEGNTPPNYRNFTITGLVSGSRVKIKKTSDGTSVHNAVVNATSLTISYNAGTANTPVTIDIRKGSAAPYYKPLRTTSSISYLADTEISVTQIEAIAASTYDADVATDWSINTGTKAITRNSGGQYPLQDLYSWLLDYYDDSSTVDLDMPIEGITPAQFELINSGSITDADMEYLNGGSLWDGTTLWANLTVVGTLAADTTVYVHVDGAEYTGYWGTGNIDVSLKFSAFDGTEVVDVRAHKYTDTYDHWHFDGLGEGLNYAALSTADDPNNQTASGTVAAYGITVTVDNPTGKQIDGADTPADYTTTVDANGLGVQEAYEYLKYLTKEKSVYVSANSAYDEVKTAPYGTFAGGTFFGARGIWLENVASGDALNYVLTDNVGVTHQASAPPVSITVTNIASSTVTIIQLYDLTNLTQLYVGEVTGASFSLTKTWTANIDVRVRVAGFSGSTAYEFFESVGSFTATGMNMRVTQTADNVYNINGINGSTITNVAINDGALLVSVSTGSISWQDLYAYGVYWLATEAGIVDEGSFVEAIDPVNYLWSNFKLKNTTDPSVPLLITGGWGRDAATNSTLSMIDTSGGTIISTPDQVIPYAAGAEATVAIVQSGLTAQGYSTSRAVNLDTLSGGSIDANLVSVNGVAVSGSGTEQDPWGP